MELMRHESIATTQAFYVGKNAERTADAVWEAFERSTGTPEAGKVQFDAQLAPGSKRFGNEG